MIDLLILAALTLLSYYVIVSISSEKNPKIRKKQAPFKSKLRYVPFDLTGIKLSDEQQWLFDIVENTNSHLYLTGKAGTGKSVLLQFIKQRSKKRLVVVAPTGVAALNVGGQTIHSLFRIPPSFVRKNSLKVGYKTKMILRNIDMVVIDEISMVRTDLMDAVDSLLRQARENDIPFGGVQMVMFGDLYQLPPVVDDPELHKYFADNHGGYYFFNASAWQNTPYKIFELHQVFRQKDESFIKILNSIRTGNYDDNFFVMLNKRAGLEIPDANIITLATTNDAVSRINSYQLSRLPGTSHKYQAIISGDLQKSSFPTDEILHLKVGAQVMLIRNDREKRWVNGTIGKIHSLSENNIKIDINGIIYSLSQDTWSKIRYFYDQEKRQVDEEVVSSFTQFPLKLAWAITIHKSQGQTYESVIVDMGNGAFTHGQTYVALSRCKSLEGLYLRRELMKEDVIVDPDIINFMSKAQILEK